MNRFIWIVSCVFLAGLTFNLFPSDAEGCATVRRSDRPEDSVRIAEESAIIVWDPVKKVEHFIRRAAFDTKSPDFGFLVPTPSAPIMKEVEDGIFREMDRWILPITVEQTKFKFDAILLSIGGCSSKSAMRMVDKGVRVLGEQKVGGYETAILDGDSTEAVSKWLKDKGYSNDPELQSWLVPYIANKWKITAFKIMQDPATGKLATTKPVRMSFATDKPFFPYREPEGKDDKKNHGSRLLRVFFVSSERMDAKLGHAAWHATIPWSDQLTAEQRESLAKETGLQENDLPAKAWMTTFEDVASPRPGKEEVYFEPASNRSPIRPTPFITYNKIWIPIDVALAGIMFLVLIGLAIKRVGWKAILPRGKPPRPETPKGPLYPPWSAS